MHWKIAGWSLVEFVLGNDLGVVQVEVLLHDYGEGVELSLGLEGLLVRQES